MDQHFRDNKDSSSNNGSISQGSNLNFNSDPNKKKGRKSIRKMQENNFLQNQIMFNIQENENETTGNFVAVDMNQRNEVPHDRPKLALKEQGSIKLARKNSNLKRSTAQGFNRQTSYKSSKFGLGDQEKRTSGYNDSSSSQDNNLFSN